MNEAVPRLVTDAELRRLSRVIRPVKSVLREPTGKWPQDEAQVFYLRLPRGLRTANLCYCKCGKKAPLLYEVQRLVTLHVPGSAGRCFHPTLEEVYSQIPESLLGDGQLPANRIVAFETFLENRDPSWSRGYHEAVTVLLGLAQPYSGILQDFHYR